MCLEGSVAQVDLGHGLMRVVHVPLNIDNDEV